MEWEEGRCTYCMKQEVSKRIERTLHYKICVQQTLMLKPIALQNGHASGHRRLTGKQTQIHKRIQPHHLTPLFDHYLPLPY